MARYKKRSYRRKRKSMKRKRQWKRGYSRKQRRRLAPASNRKVDLMPKEKTVNLRWCETYGIAASDIVPVKLLRVFNASSPFDPDVTGLGSSAKGYKFYAKYYRIYQVIASKVCIRYVQQEREIPSTPLVLCGNVDHTAQFFDATSMDYRTWATCAHTKLQWLNATDPGTTGRKMVTMTMSMNTKKLQSFYNIRDVTTLTSSVTTNPLNCMYFAFATSAVDLVTQLPPAILSVVIDYKVRFSSLKPIDWTGEALEVQDEVDATVHPYAGDPATDGPVPVGHIEPPLTPPPP